MTSLNVAYIQDDSGADEYNPNLPKMPLRLNNDKIVYMPFYEFRQPWRSTYYESQGISKMKENDSIKDYARLEYEYGHVQPLLNDALIQNGTNYSDILKSQDSKLFYNGYAGMGTSSLFKGVRFTSNFNNEADIKFGKYMYVNNYNPAFLDESGLPDLSAMRNTYRPCIFIDGYWKYADLVKPEPLHNGLYCSTKNSFHSMPINPKRPGEDASFGIIFDEDSRVATKPFQEIVEMVTKTLVVANQNGFGSEKEANNFKDIIIKNSVNPITATFASSLVTVKAKNGRVYVLPNMPS